MKEAGCFIQPLFYILMICEQFSPQFSQFLLIAFQDQ